MIARLLPNQRHLISAFLTVALFLGAAAPGWAQSDEDANGNQLKQQYDEVLGKEAELERAIDAQAVRMVEIAAEINGLEQELAEVDLQLVASRRRLVDAETEEASARRSVRVARRRVGKATDDLHAQAVSAYIGGGTPAPSVEMVLRSFEGLNESERASSYAGVLVDHQRDVVGEYRAAKAASTQAANSASQSRSDAQRIRDTIATAKSTLEIKRVQLEKLKVDATEAAAVQLVARQSLLSKKLEIEARISRLEKASDGIGLVLYSTQVREPDYDSGSIEFSPPLPGVAPGSPFGMRYHPILHYERLHAGIDFGASPGTPIHAAADGVVVIAGPRGGYGNATVIDHGSGIATVYAHQSQIIVRPGQLVKRGDVIGAVGTTGLSTGPHLHFEARVRGIPVNPSSLMDLNPG